MTDAERIVQALESLLSTNFKEPNSDFAEGWERGYLAALELAVGQAKSIVGGF